MSFLEMFFSSSAKKLEQKGDSFFQAGLWVQAKQAYEHALDKLESNVNESSYDQLRLNEKIDKAVEALVREHLKNAENYLEGEYFDEARELLLLAHEVSSDEQVKKELEKKIRDIELQQSGIIPDNMVYGTHNPEDEDEDEEEDDITENNKWNLSEDEEFAALCNTLPNEICAAYNRYGRNFKTGYVALNQGDFQSALINLKNARKENPEPDSYIPLELATAYMNIDQMDEARTLLENFIPYHREALPAYQLLCEVYWDQKDFSKVEALLDSVPEKLKKSIGVILLQGETLYQSGNHEKAKIFYKEFLQSYGWHETIARELAKVLEAVGELDNARNLYKTLIRHCTDCHSRVDPEIKDKYAELSFSSGIYNTEILEMYLSLAGEMPEESARYFDRISRIYKAQGNFHEANRFRAFSNRAKKSEGGSYE